MVPIRPIVPMSMAIMTSRSVKPSRAASTFHGRITLSFGGDEAGQAADVDDERGIGVDRRQEFVAQEHAPVGGCCVVLPREVKMMSLRAWREVTGGDAAGQGRVLCRGQECRRSVRPRSPPSCRRPDHGPGIEPSSVNVVVGAARGDSSR